MVVKHEEFFGIELPPGIAFVTRLPYSLVVQPHENLEVGLLHGGS